MRVPSRRSGPVLTLLLAATLTLLGGCTVGDVRWDAPADPSPVPAGSGPGAPVEQRRVPVPVPPGDGLRQVEFVDAEHGYAMFVGPAGAATPGARGETATVFATADAGRSWQPLRHPRPVAQNHQLYAGGGHLVLLAEPHGWYVSADAGRTFSHDPRTVGSPVGYHLALGRFRVCCQDDERPRLVDGVADGGRPQPAQPPLPVLGTVAYAGGRLVAAGLRDGQPYVTVSGDQGRTWRPASALTSDRELFLVRPMVAADGDAWLVGHADEPTVFPELWHFAGDRWIARAVSGRPERFVSVVPVGGGLLATTGPNGPGLITPDGRYAELPWPVGDTYLRVLDDGTLFGANSSTGDIWLGRGRGARWSWISLRLDRM